MPHKLVDLTKQDISNAVQYIQLLATNPMSTQGLIAKSNLSELKSKRKNGNADLRSRRVIMRLREAIVVPEDETEEITKKSRKRKHDGSSHADGPPRKRRRRQPDYIEIDDDDQLEEWPSPTHDRRATSQTEYTNGLSTSLNLMNFGNMDRLLSFPGFSFGTAIDSLLNSVNPTFCSIHDKYPNGMRNENGACEKDCCNLPSSQSPENACSSLSCERIDAFFCSSHETLNLIPNKNPKRLSSVFDDWTIGEIALFETGICVKGKDFYEISKMIGTKNTKQVVQFYYVWKQSSHYQVWKKYGKQQRLMETKKRMISYENLDKVIKDYMLEE